MKPKEKLQRQVDENVKSVDRKSKLWNAGFSYPEGESHKKTGRENRRRTKGFGNAPWPVCKGLTERAMKEPEVQELETVRQETAQDHPGAAAAR